MSKEGAIEPFCGAEFLNDDDEEDDEARFDDRLSADEDSTPKVNGFMDGEDDEEEEYDDDDVRADEDYDYERDEVNNEPRGANRGGSSAILTSRLAETPIKSVKVWFRISGSMNKFASSSDATMMEIAGQSSGIFGKGTQHIVKGIHLIRLHSTFPVSLLWDIHDVRGVEKKRVFTQTGASGAFISAPQEKRDGGVAVPLIDESSKPDAQFLKVFPGWTLDNIDTGIAKLGLGQASVQTNHPVVAVIKRAYERAGGTNRLEEKHAGFFFVTEGLLDRSMELLKKDMQRGLPITNLNKLKLSISRAVTSTADNKVGSHGKEDTGAAQSQWKDMAEIGQNIRMRHLSRNLMDEEFSAYAELQIYFRDA